MLKHQFFNLSEVLRGNSPVRRQGNGRGKPEFAFALGSPYVDVGRLLPLVGVKVKSESSDAQDRRHSVTVRRRRRESSSICPTPPGGTAGRPPVRSAGNATEPPQLPGDHSRPFISLLIRSWPGRRLPSPRMKQRSHGESSSQVKIRSPIARGGLNAAASGVVRASFASIAPIDCACRRLFWIGSFRRFPRADRRQ